MMSFCSSFLLLFLFTITCILEMPSFAAPATTKMGSGYRLLDIGESPDGAGLVGILQVKEKTTSYGADIPFLQLSVRHETENRLRVHISDAEKQRWEVPYDLLPRETPPPPLMKHGFRPRQTKKNTLPSSGEYAGNELIFTYTADPFTFSVRRKSNGQTLFNTSADPYNTLVFKDQYLELSTKLPEDASIYGLGENTQPAGIKLRPNDPYTLYTSDVSSITLNTDLYGSHPVYMDLRAADGKAAAHAVLLLNSNGMDVFYRGKWLTYKVIGGVIDLYFMSGPSPLDVVDQYTALIGRPAAMPYWAFGFHQCRWGYHNLSVVEDVVQSYNKAQIPLDVIWNDDDHMDNHKDFTLSSSNYPHSKLIAFLDKIHARGMKYVVIVDPGIGVNKSYGVYQRAIEKDVFIKYKGKPYLAQVWPGAVNFPDYLNPKTVDWWGDEIRRFHDLVPVDGLWIDMNEASNFCSGLCTLPEGRVCPNKTSKGWICCLDCQDMEKSRWDDPPYKINASGTQLPIGYKTIATSAYHYNGVLEYDAHSLYGFSQAIATHKALERLDGKGKRRPFVLTRSTFVGSGRYAAHWTGDNKGTWDDLRYSISTMLNFGIFGIPMVGSDICGFYPAPTEELCNRWIEVGAFYPFSRDHANFYSPRQELYRWKSVAISARNALGMRYKILPYLYTLNYEAHTHGWPIARPLFFSFPNETRLHGLSTQFLLGSALMVSPVLTKQSRVVKAMFPPGTWYNMFRLTEAVVSKKSHFLTLDAPLHVINVHVYQNSIVPMQRGGMVSKEARMTPFTLVVAFPVGAAAAEARGNLFLDDDERPEMDIRENHSTYVDFWATVGSGEVKVWSEVRESKFALDNGWIVEKIVVLGLRSGVNRSGLKIEIDGSGNGDRESSSMVEFSSWDHEIFPERLEGGNYVKSVMLEIKGLNLAIGKNFAISSKLS